MIKFIRKHFLMFPLILVEAYLLFTILLYEFGPLDWKTENKGLFWFLIISYHVAFILGYVFSIKKINIRKSAWDVNKIEPKKFELLIWGVIIICAISACIEYRNVMHASSYLPYELPHNFIQGLLDPGKQYYNKFSVPDGFTSNKFITMLSALVSFIYISLVPILVIWWKKIKVLQKTCMLVLVFFKVAFFVSVGTNKGIFDTMFVFGGIILILVLLNLYHGNEEQIDRKTLIKVSAILLGLIVFSFTYFTMNISSRVQSPIEYAINDTIDEESEEQIDAPIPESDSFINRMFYSVTNYLTQGYYGMSLSVDEEFTSTYGIGNSQFLSSNFKSIFGIDVQDRTYQHKVTKKWDEYGKWHSFYSYIANDISYYGVIVFMLILGIFYGCICKDVILNDSFVGKLILIVFVIMFAYMPANNQVFTAMATFTAFFELSLLWILGKVVKNKGKKA